MFYKWKNTFYSIWKLQELQKYKILITTATTLRETSVMEKAVVREGNRILTFCKWTLRDRIKETYQPWKSKAESEASLSKY